MSSENALRNRLAEERVTADTHAEGLPHDTRQRWHACGSSHRFFAYYGKKLVAYRLLFHTPQVIDTFTCKGLDTGLQQGVQSLWESEATGESFWVSATPKEVAENCFLWMLKYTSLETAAYKNKPSLRFTLAYRTLKNPTNKEDGVVYLLEKSVFDNTSFDQ